MKVEKWDNSRNRVIILSGEKTTIRYNSERKERENEKDNVNII